MFLTPEIFTTGGLKKIIIIIILTNFGLDRCLTAEPIGLHVCTMKLSIHAEKDIQTEGEQSVNSDVSNINLLVGTLSVSSGHCTMHMLCM